MLRSWAGLAFIWSWNIPRPKTPTGTDPRRVRTGNKYCILVGVVFHQPRVRRIASRAKSSSVFAQPRRSAMRAARGVIAARIRLPRVDQSITEKKSICKMRTEYRIVKLDEKTAERLHKIPVNMS